MTADQIERMKKLRDDGLSYRAIGDEVGCSGGTVRRNLVPGEMEKHSKLGYKWRSENPDYHLKYGKKWSLENPEYRREYHVKNKEADNERSSKWRNDNPNYRHEYYITNRDTEIERSSKYRDENPEYQREYRERFPGYNRKWAKNNPDKIRAKSARERSVRRGATVGDLSKIQDIYDRATNDPDVACYLHLKGCPYSSGENIEMSDRHVDHMVPLSRGGLHTASNLSIACSKCNLRKGTRLLEELEEMGLTRCLK